MNPEESIMAKLTRRESRETAFELLFEWSFKDETLDEIVEAAKLARDLEPDKFALSLAEKVVESRAGLDALIERYSQGWKLSRISHTALTVLRMSFCELTKFEDIPAGATINEAVELVKKFGTDEEAAYLNGILGSFERARKEGREPAPLLLESEETEKDSPPGDNGPEETERTSPPADNEPVEGPVQEEPVKHYGGKDEPELLDDIVIEVD